MIGDCTYHHQGGIIGVSMSCSVKDSCRNKCQISKCSLCYYERVRVIQPTRPRCEPCGKRSDRQCWYKYYQCRYNYYGTYGHYVSIYYCGVQFSIYPVILLSNSLFLLQRQYYYQSSYSYKTVFKCSTRYGCH